MVLTATACPFPLSVDGFFFGVNVPCPSVSREVAIMGCFVAVYGVWRAGFDATRHGERGGRNKAVVAFFTFIYPEVAF